MVLKVDELYEAVEAYYEHGGNKTKAALALGLPRQTYSDRLNAAITQLNIKLGEVAGGQIKATKSQVFGLPAKGKVKRYILTSAQNNTNLHPGFINLKALAEFYNAQLIVGTYTYQSSAYSSQPVKNGKLLDNEEMWYAPELVPYIIDSSVEVAPGLIWCGEQNIIPTTKHPLTSFEDYNGRKSNIVPHAKIAMESVASMAHEPVKFNYSTGTITQRNYLQRRAGIIAEQKHSYGGLLVEVNGAGTWFVRQLHIADDGSIMDVGPEGYNGLLVESGKVHASHAVESIYWGDVHAAELNNSIYDLCWADGGMLDSLRPNSQFMGDVFSMTTRSHHEARDFHARYKKRAKLLDNVESEVSHTAQVLNGAARDWCISYIIPSNHDRHLDKWLNEADFRQDPINARYFCWLQYNLLKAFDKRNYDFNILEFALRERGLNPYVQFLKMDESIIVKGIENGLHGDLGPNGSRGSTRALTKLGRAINKGHDHTAAIRDNVYSAGSCATKFSYMKGPGSHSVSHIVTYKNGTRAIITMYDGKWRA